MAKKIDPYDNKSCIICKKIIYEDGGYAKSKSSGEVNYFHHNCVIKQFERWNREKKEKKNGIHK